MMGIDWQDFAVGEHRVICPQLHERLHQSVLEP